MTVEQHWPIHHNSDTGNVIKNIVILSPRSSILDDFTDPLWNGVVEAMQCSAVRTSVQRRCTIAGISARFDTWIRSSLVFISPHALSITLRSGLFAGQTGGMVPSCTKKACMHFERWILAPSCWKTLCVHRWFSFKYGKQEVFQNCTVLDGVRCLHFAHAFSPWITPEKKQKYGLSLYQFFNIHVDFFPEIRFHAPFGGRL